MNSEYLHMPSLCEDRDKIGEKAADVYVGEWRGAKNMVGVVGPGGVCSKVMTLKEQNNNNNKKNEKVHLDLRSVVTRGGTPWS